MASKRPASASSVAAADTSVESLLLQLANAHPDVSAMGRPGLHVRAGAACIGYCKRLDGDIPCSHSIANATVIFHNAAASCHSSDASGGTATIFHAATVPGQPCLMLFPADPNPVSAVTYQHIPARLSKTQIIHQSRHAS